MSTASVLLSFQAFLETVAKPQRSVRDDIIAVISGVVALLFRQTNIFWVAVFPAGLTVVSVLKNNGGMRSRVATNGYVAVLKESWTQSKIFDHSLREGGLAISGSFVEDLWKT